MISHDGTAGMCQSIIHEYTYSWEDRSLLLMYSDGLISRWTFDPYPGLLTRSATMIAGMLYRDFNRGSDDTTIIVVKQNSEMQNNRTPSGCKPI
jgi:hypothetical protein